MRGLDDLRIKIDAYHELFDAAARAREAVQAEWPLSHINNELLPEGHPLVEAMFAAQKRRNEARDELHALLDKILARR